MTEELIIYTPMYVTFFWMIVLLSVNSKKNQSKKFLGVFMAVAFVVYFSHALFFKGLYHTYMFLDPFYMLASLSVYPLYYWYIKLMTIEPELRWYNLRLFIPALIMAMLTGFIYTVMSPAEKIDYLNGFLLERNVYSSDNQVILMQIIVFFIGRLIFATQVIIFLVYGRNLILVYNSRISNFYSDTKSRNLNWVNYLLFAIVLTSVMSIVFNAIGRSVFIHSSRLLFIPSAAFSVLLFIIGYLGYIQAHTVHDLIEDEGNTEMKLKEINQVHLKERLLVLFEKQKIYRQPDLKITQISAELQTNRTYISNLINQEFSCSFNEFVNCYRIEEAKKLIGDKAAKNFSLEWISEEAGFGSVSTFIRVFKEHENTTPGKYRDRLLLQSQLLLPDDNRGVNRELS